MSKVKNLCDWSKTDIDRHLPALIKLIAKPKYICRSCARVANDKDLLCKGIKIKRLV